MPKPTLSASSSAILLDPLHASITMMDFVKYLWKSAKFVRSRELTINSRMYETQSCGSNASVLCQDVNGANIFSVELVLHIFSYMDVKTLCQCARACLLWNELAQDHTLWKQLCISNTHLETNTNSLPTWASNWRELFRFNYESKTNIFSQGQIKEGRGSFSWTNGAKFEGDWKNDKENGRGKKVWMDGATFDGEWEDGKFSGKGVHTWASGSRYQGSWKKHKRNGFGRNVWPQKDIYEGEWLEDQKSGLGTYTWADGRVYIGYWENDKRCGHGTFVWSPMGYKYEGEWLNDRGHGIGSFHWGDGYYYEGGWVNGRRCGKGKYHTPCGRVFFQEWNEEREFNASDRGDLSHELAADMLESPKRKVEETGQGNDTMDIETYFPDHKKRRSDPSWE